MTHPAIYTISFTFHISNHDGLRKHQLCLTKVTGFTEREQSSRNFDLPQSNFLKAIDLLYFKQCYSLTAIYSPCQYFQGNLISHKRSNGGS